MTLSVCFAEAQRLVFEAQERAMQDDSQQEDSSQQKTEMPEMDMPGMNMTQPELAWMPSPHDSSGTGWQPAATPGHAWMKPIGAWDLMAHGVVFTDYNQQGGPRGEGKAESVNWLMLMEERKLGSGNVLFREMFSAESLTSPHPGFPELFQAGDTYHRQPLVDHQHPHNVFAELSFDYTHPIGVLFKEKVSWEFYGAAAGEAAPGPGAFLPPASAAELPRGA